MAIHNFCSQCGYITSPSTIECINCKQDPETLQREKLELLKDISAHRKKLQELHDIILAKEERLKYLSGVLTQ